MTSMNQLLLNILIFLSIVTGAIGQNYFQDPSFDEPTVSTRTVTDCGGTSAEAFDKNSKIYKRIGDGTPDIVVPIKEDCRRRAKNSLISSQCLGMIFKRTTHPQNRIYKEPVSTKLKRPLSTNSVYEISFDFLLNTRHYYDDLGLVPYLTSHFNVVLLSSSSGITDTLVLPVSQQSYDHWERLKLVFTSKSEFDIVQFDFYSERFYDSQHDAFLYTYLDNFKLQSSTEKPTVFTKVNLESESLLNSEEFEYYFNSNEETLSSDERSRLLSDIKPVSLQEVKTITILAYTDNVSGVNYNKLLSSRRAEYVLQLVKKYFKDHSIEYTAKGEGVDNRQQLEKARRVEITLEYKEGEVAPWYKTSTNEQYSVNYSYLGNIEESKREDGVATSKSYQENSPPRFDEVPFDAKKMIIAKAKKAKVLIINESHTSPDHREFISSLLSELKNQGYSKLAVESLQNKNELHSLTFKDPVFLRYLLAAQNLGYELLSYDNKTSIEPKWQDVRQLEGVEYVKGFENIAKDMNIRDYNQFLNLEEDIDSLTVSEKMIIHVGHGHGNKIQIGEWKSLGSYLSDKYGSDAVLSVDQVTLNNCSALDSNEYYQRYKPAKSIVCSVGGRPYLEKEFNPLTFTFETTVDLQVLHPGIGVGLDIDTSYIYVEHMGLQDISYPLAIMIYESDANPRTDIAYSAIEVKHKEDLKPSIIPNNYGYSVLIKDSENNVVAYDTDRK